MLDDDKWPAMHAYRKAVAHGDAPSIFCPEAGCGAEMLTVVGTRGEPALRCMSCRVVYNIGLDVWEQIEGNIREVSQTLRERE